MCSATPSGSCGARTEQVAGCTPAAQHVGALGTGAAAAASPSSSPQARARAFGRRVSHKMAMSGLAGPDVSSWGALWSSIMCSLLGHQAAPLLQSVISDLYAAGCLLVSAGTSAAAAAAGAGGSAGRGAGAAHLRCASAGSAASGAASGWASPPLPLAAGLVHGGPSSPGGSSTLARTSKASSSGVLVITDGLQPMDKVAGERSVGAAPIRSRLGGAAAALTGRVVAAANSARERIARLTDTASRGSSSSVGGGSLRASTSSAGSLGSLRASTDKPGTEGAADNAGGADTSGQVGRGSGGGTCVRTSVAELASVQGSIVWLDQLPSMRISAACSSGGTPCTAATNMETAMPASVGAA